MTLLIRSRDSYCTFGNVLYFFCNFALGTVYGFNVAASKSIQDMAEKKGIILKSHNVIYRLVDDLKEELSNKLQPTTEEIILGKILLPLV